MTTYQEVSNALANAERSLAMTEGRLFQLAESGKSLQTKIASLDTSQSLNAAASTLLEELARRRTERVLGTLEALASEGLRQVMGESLQLKIALTTLRGAPAAQISLDDGELETPIMDARGGGVAALTGFLLRLGTLLLTPSVRRVLVLDETFAQLSEDYEESLGEFLRDVAARSETQILLVTHSRTLAEGADQIVRVSRKQGASSAQALSR